MDRLLTASQVRALWDEHRQVSALARTLGVHVQTARRLCRAAGIDTRAESRGRAIILKQEPVQGQGA